VTVFDTVRAFVVLHHYRQFNAVLKWPFLQWGNFNK